jgi:hypothetical protein
MIPELGKIWHNEKPLLSIGFRQKGLFLSAEFEVDNISEKLFYELLFKFLRK